MSLKVTLQPGFLHEAEGVGEMFTDPGTKMLLLGDMSGKADFDGVLVEGSAATQWECVFAILVSPFTNRSMFFLNLLISGLIS